MTTRHRGAAAAVALSLLLAACGATVTPSPSTGPGGSAKPSILPIPITELFRVGENRILFTLTDQTGKNQVAAPSRSLTIGYHGPTGETIAPAKQTFIWAIEGANGVYVGNTTFDSAGAWTADFITAAPGQPTETTTFGFDVLERLPFVAPGDPAPSVKTPTLADVGGDVAKISSDPKPVKAFYEVSEADALAARKPFVVIFATPKFCQTAVCGPTLDKLKPIAAAHPEMTFINVEPYQLEFKDGSLQPVLSGNPATLTPADATNAFKLTHEPVVYVVGADGKVTTMFELVFSPEEIEAAIAAVEKAG